MCIKKNQNLYMTIDDMGNDGEGIGHADGYTLFIKGALPGEYVEVVVTKVKKNYGFARLLDIIKPSPDRVETVCPVAGKCGGCDLAHLSYEAQLKYKEKKVRDCLVRIGKVDESKVEWLPIVGMEKDTPLHYRCKAQFPIGYDENKKAVVGFYASSSHRIIECDDCAIQHPDINKAVQIVINLIREAQIKTNNKHWIYDEKSHTGWLRHIYVRRGYTTGQVMVCLVVNDILPTDYPDTGISKELLLAFDRDIHLSARDNLSQTGRQISDEDFTSSQAEGKSGESYIRETFLSELIKRLKTISGMTSILLNQNTKKTNVILGDKYYLIYGKSYIEDSINGITYRISAASFYQVNPIQTDKLYRIATDFANIKRGDIIYDLYCGIGAITLQLAKRLEETKHEKHTLHDTKKESYDADDNGMIIGIEIVPDAVKDANYNAINNNIKTVSFHCGGASEYLTEHVTNERHADTVVIDPPRKGCDENLIHTIEKINPSCIVYVSCDPATLARDVKRLSEHGYHLKKVRPVDMFPWTKHIECVIKLQRRDM